VAVRGAVLCCAHIIGKAFFTFLTGMNRSKSHESHVLRFLVQQLNQQHREAADHDKWYKAGYMDRFSVPRECIALEPYDIRKTGIDNSYRTARIRTSGSQCHDD
jgi:hypothetical protein